MTTLPLLSTPVQVYKASKRIHLVFGYRKHLVDEIRCMVGAKWDGHHWSVTDCLRNQLQLAILAGDNPFLRYDVPLHNVRPTRSLYQHQVEMLQHLYTRERAIVAAEQGTGKTLATIEWMELCGGRFLYVAPARVVPAIKRELAKWNCAADVTLMSYAKMRQVQQWKGDTDKRIKHVIGFQPDGLVLDESDYVKSPGSQQTRAARHIADRCRFVALLSGDPAPKDPTDWWAQCEIACPGFLRESNVAHLRARLAVLEEREVGEHVFSEVVDWKWDEVEKLHRRMQGLVRVWRAKDCQDLPPLRVERIHLTVSPEAREAAKVAAASCLTSSQALNKTRQISDGFLYTEDGTTVRGNTPKDDALRDLLAQEEAVGRIVICAAYRDSVDRCVDLCREAGWDVLRLDGRGYWPSGGEALLSEFDAATRTPGGKWALVCHPKSGGYGLTLHAARAAVCFSNTFSGAERWQFLKRIHREGMPNRAAVVYDLVHLKTDELVLDNLDQKRALLDVTLGIPLEEVQACLNSD